jgi:hypothetical protein
LWTYTNLFSNFWQLEKIILKNGIICERIQIFLPEQYALTYYGQPRNNLLMPIVRKTRLTDNMRTNLKGKIRKLFVVYYSTRVIRSSSKSHIRNQYTVIALSININYEQKKYWIIQFYYCFWSIFPSILMLCCKILYRQANWLKSTLLAK